MDIRFDPNKRIKTLEERQLDFCHARHVFEGRYYTFRDERFDYGEPRFVTIGYLQERMIVLVWTQRENTRHIISMRKANEREQKRYQAYLD